MASEAEETCRWRPQSPGVFPTADGTENRSAGPIDIPSAAEEGAVARLRIVRRNSELLPDALRLLQEFKDAHESLHGRIERFFSERCPEGTQTLRRRPGMSGGSPVVAERRKIWTDIILKQFALEMVVSEGGYGTALLQKMARVLKLIFMKNQFVRLSQRALEAFAMVVQCENVGSGAAGTTIQSFRKRAAAWIPYDSTASALLVCTDANAPAWKLPAAAPAESFMGTECRSRTYAARTVPGRCSSSPLSTLPSAENIVAVALLNILSRLHYVEHAGNLLRSSANGTVAGSRFAVTPDSIFSLACDLWCNGFSRERPPIPEFSRFVAGAQHLLYSLARDVDGLSDFLGGTNCDGTDCPDNAQNVWGRAYFEAGHLRNIRALACRLRCECETVRTQIWDASPIGRTDTDDLRAALVGISGFSQVWELREFTATNEATQTVQVGGTAEHGRRSAWPCDVTWTVSLASSAVGVPECQIVHTTVCEGMTFLTAGGKNLDILLQGALTVALERGAAFGCVQFFPIVCVLLLSGWTVADCRRNRLWRKLLVASVRWLMRMCLHDSNDDCRCSADGCDRCDSFGENDEPMMEYAGVADLVEAFARHAGKDTSRLEKARDVLGSLLLLRKPWTISGTLAGMLGWTDRKDRHRFSTAGCSDSETVQRNLELWKSILRKPGSSTSGTVLNEVLSSLTVGPAACLRRRRGLLAEETLNRSSLASFDAETRLLDLAPPVSKMDPGLVSAVTWFLCALETMHYGRRATGPKSASLPDIAGAARRGEVVVFFRRCDGKEFAAGSFFPLADSPLSSRKCGMVCGGCGKRTTVSKPPGASVLPFKHSNLMNCLVLSRFDFLPRQGSCVGLDVQVVREASKRNLDGPAPDPSSMDEVRKRFCTDMAVPGRSSDPSMDDFN